MKGQTKDNFKCVNIAQPSTCFLSCSDMILARDFGEKNPSYPRSFNAGRKRVNTDSTHGKAIESAIGGNAYQHSKVNQWTTNVVEQTLSQLTKLGKPFKYIVTCVIMQKNGAGLHTASSCFWDSSTDGSCTVRWENKTMYCIVSAFGLST
eukprot:bmy_21554T0